jgi:hypothetical protein
MMIDEGHVMRSAYVKTAEIVFPMGGRPMAVASVEEKVRRASAYPGREFYPLPVGKWVERRFHLWDGRHRYIAALMLGQETMLVCWTEPATE